MMLSASPPSLTRSSLEVMLDALRRRDEEVKPKDLPPALPARPTSKARLPSARRSLPNNFKVGDDGDGGSAVNRSSISCCDVKEDSSKRKEKDFGFKRSIFGSKKTKKEAESPYVAVAPKDNNGRSEQPVSTTSFHAALSGKDGKLDWDDDFAGFMKRKLHVWCRQPNGHWALGTVRSTLGEEASVSLSNGHVTKVQIGELLPSNSDILDGVDDLLQLSYLNEPSVLHNLRVRYSRDMIYTKAGPVLIALNPFKDLELYSNDNISTYRQNLVESPHVYAVADAAYTQMLRDDVNQSIIIGGESGAGKTETAKIAMRCIATLGGGSSGIENEILQTSCILEAFGNAKTSRNDNSSRFGKLMEIHFDSRGKICGGEIETFLLEKSRVVYLSKDERTYHIFYQLCAGATSILKERLNLKMANEYKYLNQSECITIGGVDDSANFSRLLKALSSLRICKEDQEHIFEILAAILWLGNISFLVADKENHVEVTVDEALISTAKLIGCDSEELKLALSTRKIQCGMDMISEKLTLRQAVDARDALAKFMYLSLFNWLVQRINKSLEVGKQFRGRSISILDIYGFESFQRNSFEQFCINYANERLQQHFNRHLFKLEQEDYELDGIDWTKVSFADNQECLDLFEKKTPGLLSLLDEESDMPKATDLTFANKLKQHLSINPCFKGERGRAFTVRHCAGEVLYDTNGFLEKNRDPLHTNYIQLLLSCNWQLLKLAATKMLHQMETNATQKQSIGAKFKDQVFKLMHQLDNTTPHFVRCIRPNTKRLPGVYDEQLVLQQLRCYGVLEVVRISRSGYSTRMRHLDFAGRYGFLLSEGNVLKDPLSISVAILQHFRIQPEMYQVGYTKVFMRTGQIDILETRRKHVMLGALSIQKQYRGCMARRHFHCLRNIATTLQSFIRGEIIRKRCSFVVTSSLPDSSGTPLEFHAIVKLQSVIRGWLVRLHAKDMHNIGKESLGNAKPRQKESGKVPEMKETSKERNLLSALAVLRKQVLNLESALEQKEKENAALREQVRQSDKRWIDYEMKMKSMEELWQKQMSSLQMSLAAAKRSLATDNAAFQPGRIDVSSPRLYDSEDVVSIGSRTPGESTPIKYSDIGRREANGSLRTVSNLAKEFECHRQTFDNEAKLLIEVKSAQPANNNSDDDLRRLKHRFEAWKKEYKVRLRDTRSRLHKLGNSELDKGRRKWWGKFSARIS